MENAIKALYMGVGMLIAVMVLGVLVYMFRNGARLGASYEGSVNTAQVRSFNSQFDIYAKITNQATDAADGYAFIEKGNTVSDIITCANLAMSINEKNDYDEKNNVQVIVVIDAHTKYSIYPIENQPKNRFIKTMSLSTAKTVSNFTDSNSLDFYDFLKKYGKVQIVDINTGDINHYNSSSETIYEYYFDVDKDENGVSNQALSYFETTGKINKIVFTLNPTEHFDLTSNPYWTEAR